MSDLVAQKVFEKKSTLNLMRCIKFSAIGGMLSPIIHTWYGFCDKIFRAKTKWTPLIRLAVDQLLFSPSLNILFFSILSIFDGQPGRIIPSLRTNLLPTMLMSWRVWPLAMYINFNYVPQQLRVLFGNLVGFAWSIFLSMRASRK